MIQPSEKLTQILQNSQRLFVGLSGGADSVALLHWCTQKLRFDFPQLSFVAVHINHQISANSSSWEMLCQQLCKQLSCELVVRQIRLEKESGSYELEARLKRRSVFSEFLQNRGDVLFTAHHADDQTETLLYRLCRGTGIEGAAAIRETTPLAQGKLVRPLLRLQKSFLEEYCREHQLTYVCDESNADQTMDRNFLRHEIIPALVGRWPKAVANISRSIQNFSQAAKLLEAYLTADLNSCGRQEEHFGESLLLQKLSTFSRDKQIFILKIWFELAAEHFSRENYLPPDFEKLDCLRKWLDNPIDDTVFALEWSSVVLRFFAGKIYCLDRERLSSVKQSVDKYRKNKKIFFIEIDDEPNSFVQRSISADLVIFTQSSKNIACLKPGKYAVKFRETGERAKPADRHRSQNLKKLFLEYRLPPWLRDITPILYDADQVAAVAGLFVCEQWKGNSGGAIQVSYAAES